MITPNQTFTCVCQKCKGEWMTQSNKLPAVCRHCKTTKWNDDYTPTVTPKKTILDHVKELTTAQRMTLFEAFELCCGMNRGDCICEVETVTVKPIASPVSVPAGMNDAMARFLAKVDSKPIVEEVEEVWEFTKDKVWYDDTNAPQRKQWLVGSKATFRIVEVNEFDYDVIERVSK